MGVIMFGNKTPEEKEKVKEFFTEEMGAKNTKEIGKMIKKMGTEFLSSAVGSESSKANGKTTIKTEKEDSILKTPRNDMKVE